MYASLAGSASSVQMTAADLHNAARLLSNPGSTTRYVRAGRNPPARCSSCAAPQERRQQDRGARRGGYGEKG
jgi:hypothetical protein